MPELHDQLVHGVRESIRFLIAGSTVDFDGTAGKGETPGDFFKAGPAGRVWGSFVDSGFEITFSSPQSTPIRLRVSRSPLKLTPLEMRVLGRIPDALAAVVGSGGETRNLRLASRVAARLAFEHILVAKFLRGGSSGSYWTPTDVLLRLQRLSERSYEGKSCTSGFVYTSQPDLYIPRLASTPYELLPFPNGLRHDSIEFSNPAAFRYVDGRNAFYLIDNLQSVLGVLRAKRPQMYDIVARSNGEHLKPLVSKMPGRPWAAYVGLNADVNVLSSPSTHFQWERGHWRLRDNSPLLDVLLDSGCSAAAARCLLELATTLSELRSGCVFLLQEDEKVAPKVIGTIDASPFGGALSQSVLNHTVQQLANSHAAVGVLSSDGLTRVSRAGKILGCGEIVDLSSSGGAVSGGGRTQAARAASAFGVVVKVSEDGPISVWRRGRRLIEFP